MSGSSHNVLSYTRERVDRPVHMSTGNGAWGRCRTARALVAVLLSVLVSPLYAQGAGPPDLGAAGYVILGGWLFFWIGVFVYPIALVIYSVQRWAGARTVRLDEEYVVPARGAAIVRWSVIAHIVLTLAALLLLAVG